MQKIFSLFIILLFSGSLSAQQTVKGTVTDKNNAPLSNLTVFIPELQKGTVTGTDGTFSIETPSTGTVTLQFTMIGFKSFLKTVNLTEPASDLKINLQASSTELEEVVVTSNNVKLPGNIPYSVNAVSKEELDATAGLTMMSKLAYQPGIDRISVGNGIGKPVIRGNSFNRILLYSMGTRIENQQWDDRHDLGISENGVEKVEIINGPSALIYGADALGGALIFVDEKPAAAGTSSGNAGLGASVNNFGSFVEGGYKHTNTKGLFYILNGGGHGSGSYVQGGEKPDSVKFSKNYAANSKYLDATAKGTIGISKSWGVSKLSYNFYTQRIGIVELEPDSVVAQEPEHELRTWDVEAPLQDVSLHIISNENTFLMKQSKLNVNLAYQYNDRKEYEPTGVKKVYDLNFGLKLNVFTYDLKWSSDAEKKFGFTAGTQGMMQKNENYGLESLVPDAKVKDFAGYALLRYDISKINILGGVRYDLRKIEAESPEATEEEDDLFIVQSNLNDTIHKPEIDFDKEYKPFSFSLGAAIHPTEGFTVKINGATGFSAPNYAELGTFGKHEGTFRFERGNTNLDVEQNVEGDIGLIYENEFITFNLSGYINKIKDYIYLLNTGDSIIRLNRDTLPVYDYVQNDVTISGGEAGFDIHPSGLKWLDLKVDYSLTRGELKGGGDLPFMPADKIIGQLKLISSKKIVFNEPYIAFVVSNYFKQEKVAAYEISTDGYTLLDIHVGGNFKMFKQRTSLSIFGTNIFNKGYYNHLSLIKNIGVREMGINVGFQLKVLFGG